MSVLEKFLITIDHDSITLSSLEILHTLHVASVLGL
jgi:hypothetical protein